jgi:alkylation response protein AidB-like acyl-CoA dehydrogenase
VVPPIADELDPHKSEMPRALIEQMAAKGWFGITIPAEHGGLARVLAAGRASAR